MAQQQAYQAYATTNKGTLVPGQTIAVNKYTVQVERYFSQGGFAHVYLVKTPTPVYNTTHHVLKRIAVADEAMLTEVKKEVDIMRLLKGHPNIVHLIDASWSPMSNGTYEVFILMEFCQGGGIIDMMNRRLRERLTEAEILQIFVDVCEGVAAMHNLRPAIIHRDLKVENILQASATSFKVCDFGSATAVIRPPTTVQEVRALEADLNRHTTLQYRAPEMIDLHQRRPVDEKSDVWALGVLLYKLCYYTTPFEEHGPLAILNVQYHIPPYPVYSNNMNTLIASMLREFGTQRPTVFELLTQVHQLRGTTSRFTYKIPSPQPFLPGASSAAPPVPQLNPLENVISYRPISSNAIQRSSPSNSRTPGAQARDTVLEAIAPMRRGRPSSSQQNDSAITSPSRPSSPTQHKAQTHSKSATENWLEDSFRPRDQKAGKTTSNNVPMSSTGTAVRGHRSGGATFEAWKVKNSVASPMDEPWNVGPRVAGVEHKSQIPTQGFADNFADRVTGNIPRTEGTNGRNAGGPVASVPVAGVQSALPRVNVPAVGSRNTRVSMPKGKDAFEGLGLPPGAAPPPTLGEARKLRTGLAAVSGYHISGAPPNASLSVFKPSTSASSRITPSPRPSQHAPVNSWQSNPTLPSPSASTSRTPSAAVNLASLPPESRFPTLEELDAAFNSSMPGFAPPIHFSSQPDLLSRTQDKQEKSRELVSPTPPLPPRPGLASNTSTYGRNGIRSQHVTSSAMNDLREDVKRSSPGLGNVEHNTTQGVTSSRPPLSRRNRSSVSVNRQPQHTDDLLEFRNVALPPHPSAQSEPRDWLTGDNDALISPVKEYMLTPVRTDSAEMPVLREFTSKRSSFIETSDVPVQLPQEVVTARHSPPRTFPQQSIPPSPTKKSKSGRSRERKSIPEFNDSIRRKKETPALAVSLSEKPSDSPKQSPVKKSPGEPSSSDEEEKPEDAVRAMPPKPLEKKDSTRRRKTKGRQSSVHDLVDLWGGGVVQTKEREKAPSSISVTSTAAELKTSTDSRLQRSRSAAVKPASNSRSDSPQPISLQPSGPLSTQNRSRSPKRPVGSQHVRQSSTADMSTSLASPAPSRTRPQSMFVFPASKSSSQGALDVSSSGLAVPEEGTRKSSGRRTSISDMVQKYEEAIGGKTQAQQGSGLPPPVVPKPTRLKIATHSTSTGLNGRLTASTSMAPSQPVVSRINASRSAGGNLSVPETSDSGQRNLQRTSPTGLPRTATGNDFAAEGKVADQQPAGVGSPSLSLPFHLRKAAAPTEETAPRSPSPDKPYQGVGKLIDQWQRKATATSGPLPKRTPPVARRAGLAG